MLFSTQFHPTPKMTSGKRFTEWTNVTKASPLFDGTINLICRLIWDFMISRLREARHDQIRLAKQYGIDGFLLSLLLVLRHTFVESAVGRHVGWIKKVICRFACVGQMRIDEARDAAEHQFFIGQKYLPDDDLN